MVIDISKIYEECDSLAKLQKKLSSATNYTFITEFKLSYSHPQDLIIMYSETIYISNHIAKYAKYIGHEFKDSDLIIKLESKNDQRFVDFIFEVSKVFSNKIDASEDDRLYFRESVLEYAEKVKKQDVVISGLFDDLSNAIDMLEDSD